jgi:hypothetical protein
MGECGGGKMMMTMTDDTTMTMNLPMTKTTTRRKRIAGPTLPEDPAKRTEELRKFTRDLAELYDYDYADVYDSVYFVRTVEIMKDTVFDDAATHTIRDLGRKILDTRSTSVKLYIAFFKAILVYLDSM